MTSLFRIQICIQKSEVIRRHEGNADPLLDVARQSRHGN